VCRQYDEAAFQSQICDLRLGCRRFSLTAMFRKTIFISLLLVSTAQAEPVKLTGPEITSALADATLYAGEKANIEQIFQKSGQTIYIENGQYSQGTWFVEGDKYCSLWPPGTRKSCFDVTRDGNTVTFIGSNGKPFPMRTTK
jgi:hypothetical protein